MRQLEFDFTARAKEEPSVKPAPPLRLVHSAPPPTEPSYRFPVIPKEERGRWMAVWPPPRAHSDVLDHRLEEDSFADELFALGPFPATDGPFPDERPATRAGCASIPRPCPFVSCRHHLYLDVRADGSLKINFPDREPDELAFSCSLDLAEDGPRTLDSIAALMTMSKERARQIESEAFDKLYVSLPRAYGTEMSVEDEWV